MSTGSPSNESSSQVTSSAKTPVGIVLGRSRSDRSVTPPPVNRNPSGRSNPMMSSHRRNPAKENELQLEPAKKLFLSLYGQVVNTGDPKLKGPEAVRSIVTTAKDTFDKATNAEQVANAIQTIRKAQPFLPSMTSFSQKWLDCQEQLQSLSSLEQVEHNAVRDAVSEYKQALAQGEKQYSAAVTNSDIDLAKQYLEGTCPTLASTAIEINSKIVELATKLDEADKKLDPWRDFAFFDMNEPLAKLNQIRRGFWLCSTVEAAQKSLEGMEEFKKAWKQSEKKAEDCVKELEKYRNEKKVFLDNVHEASILRGATTDPALVKLLKEANETVEIADQNTLKATSLDQLKISRKLLTQNPNLLKDCQKRAKELKEQAEKDLEAIPKYQKYYQECREARAKIAELPGAHEQLKAIDVLLSLHKIDSQGLPASGYAAAAEALKGKAESLLNAATNASKDFLARSDRQAIKEQVQILTNQLDGISSLATEYYFQMKRVQIAEASSIEKEDEAVSELKKIGLSIVDDIRDMRKLEQECLTKRGEIDKLIHQVSQTQAPKEMIEIVRKPIIGPLEGKVKELMKAGEFSAASHILERLLVAAKSLSTSMVQDFPKWNNAKLELTDIKNQCIPLLDWPWTAESTRALLENMRDLIVTTEKEYTFDSGVKGVTALKNEFAKIQKRLGESNVEDPKSLENFGKFRNDIRERMDGEYLKMQESLRSAELVLAEKGVASKGNTGIHTIVNEAWEKWRKALTQPDLAKGVDPKTYLTNESETLVKSFEKATELCSAITSKKDLQLLEKYVEEGKKDDVKVRAKKLIGEIHRLIAELESMGVSTIDYRKQMADHPKDEITPKYLQELVEIYRPIKELHDNKSRELRETSTQAKLKLDSFRSTAKNLKKKYFELPGYFDEVDRNLNDIEVMLNSEDIALISAGVSQLNALQNSLQTQTSSEEDPENPSLSTALKKWQTITAMLGKDELVKKQMRDTYEKLKGQLTDIMTRMANVGKKDSLLDPKDAMVELLKIESTVLRTVQAAEVQKELSKRFEAKFESIQLPAIQKPTQWVETDKITQLKKHTSTRVTEKTEGYWNSIETRLTKAEELSKMEGKIHEAFKELESIEREIDSMLQMSPNDARAELQKKNASIEQDQRKLRDMVRQWEQEFESFKNLVLPKTEKAMEENPKADMSQFSALSRAVDFTNKQLEPYLYVMSKLPHRYLSANEAPDMNDAIQAFGKAHKELDTHRRTAERLARNAEGTTYSYEGDLRKLQADWANRSKRFVDVMKGLASQIGTFKKEVETKGEASKDPVFKNDTGIQGSGSEQVDPDEMCKQAAALEDALSKLSSRFSPEAFDRPLAIICNKEETLEHKRAAREEALRTMRVLRNELANNVLVRAIHKSKTHPFGDVRSDLGLLFAGLKKLEISVLVAVE